MHPVFHVRPHSTEQPFPLLTGSAGSDAPQGMLVLLSARAHCWLRLHLLSSRSPRSLPSLSFPSRDCPMAGTDSTTCHCWTSCTWWLPSPWVGPQGHLCSFQLTRTKQTKPKNSCTITSISCWVFQLVAQRSSFNTRPRLEGSNTSEVLYFLLICT